MYPSASDIIDSIAALFDVPTSPALLPFEASEGAWIIDSYHILATPPTLAATYRMALEELDGGDGIYDLDEVRLDSGSIKRDGREVARFVIYIPIVLGPGNEMPEYAVEDVLAYEVEAVIP